MMTPYLKVESDHGEFGLGSMRVLQDTLLFPPICTLMNIVHFLYENIEVFLALLISSLISSLIRVILPAPLNTRVL